MRIRGDSSKKFPKKSLKVNFKSDPFINGRDVLNFYADYHDISYLHSFFSSLLFKKAGLDCVSSEHVRLYLNGSYFGLYLLTENLDEGFLFENNYDTTGNLYKAALDGACLSIFDNVYYQWEKKSGDQPDYDDLSQLISGLNNTSDNDFYNYIHESFDYNQVIGFIAMNMLIANGSTYYHNYYLHKNPETSGKWTIFPWDMDRTFSDYAIFYPYQRSSGNWTADNPLLERSLLTNEIFSDIKNKITLFQNSFFKPDSLFPLIDSLKNILYLSVLNDTTDNIPDIQTWYTKIDLDKDYIDKRCDQLSYQFNNWPFSFKVNRLSGYYVPDESITFSWHPSFDPNGNDITYNFYYGKDITLEDSTTVIIAGIYDTTFAISTALDVGKYYWKVAVTDGSTKVEGFDSYNVFFVSPPISKIMINEINYNSESSFDPGEWLEFYNADSNVADLSGWYFKDEDDQHRYSFPYGTVINPESYLVICKDTSLFFSIFPSSVNALGNFSFGLKNSGELLRLYHFTGYLVDSLVYKNDFPWPSGPNGTGATLELINPVLNNAIGYNWSSSYEHGTPGERNSTYSPESYNEITGNELTDLQIYPNPFKSSVNIVYKLTDIQTIRIRVYNSFGVLVIGNRSDRQLPGTYHLNINTQNLSPGLYYFQFLTDTKFNQVKPVVKINP